MIQGADWTVGFVYIYPGAMQKEHSFVLVFTMRLALAV